MTQSNKPLQRMIQVSVDWLHKFIQPLSAERRREVLKELGESSSPGIDFFILVVLSCTIATLGLMTDSAAVIIGAMLVAPLMSPILGISISSVAGERRIFSRAVIALLQGALLAVALSAFLGWAFYHLPFGLLKELPAEVVARTRPSPVDLVIALAGGAAAAYALAQPRLSAALPGVAIATALMPPLCTVGLGVALADRVVSLGALLLFLTNFAAISFAGILTFALLGFRPRLIAERRNHLSRSMIVSAVTVLIITVPLVLLTLRSVAQARQVEAAQQAVLQELQNYGDVQLVDLKIITSGEMENLDITIRTARELEYEQVVALQAAIAQRLDRPTALQLNVIPVRELDPLVPPTRTPTFTPGPSPTFTATATLTVTATPTETLTATQTVTLTPTDTPMPTQTFTATPMLAIIDTPGGNGAVMRAAPGNGKIIANLAEDVVVQVLYERVMVGDVLWVDIRDVFGRVGWVPAMYLRISLMP